MRSQRFPTTSAAAAARCRRMRRGRGIRRCFRSRGLHGRQVQIPQMLHHQVCMRCQHVGGQAGADRHREAARRLGRVQAVDWRPGRGWAGAWGRRVSRAPCHLLLHAAPSPGACKTQQQASPASSTTSARAALAQPRRRSASRYTSGAGLPLETYLADTICGGGGWWVAGGGGSGQRMGASPREVRSGAPHSIPAALVCTASQPGRAARAPGVGPGTAAPGPKCPGCEQSFRGSRWRRRPPAGRAPVPA